jgi:alpha-tubulin suppressor-like RCC1 family protein
MIAINKDGLLFTWGFNTSGQLGDGSTVFKSSPVQVTSLWSDEDQTNYNNTLASPIALLSWSKISCGVSHTLAIRSDGLLFAWGDNSSGQLGDNTPFNKSSPVLIGTSSWIAVSAGSTSMALRLDNTLWIWGLNTSGELGQGDTVSRSSPVQLGTSSWSQIGAGYARNFAITNTGLLYAWGNNFNGQLGDNTSVTKSSPVLIGTDSWTSIFTAKGVPNAGVYGIKNNGALFAWGADNVGQIGDGTLAIPKSSPVQITSLSSSDEVQTYAAAIGYTIVNQSWTKISVGLSHTIAIRSDGLLFAWGDNSFGQLGDNTRVSKSSPIPIGNSSWIAIAAGVVSLAIRSDNTLWTWGDNSFGFLGQNDNNISRSSPIQIGTSSWTAVATGLSVSIAIRADNRLFSWGRALGGTLGLNDDIPRSSPTQIGTSTWTSVDVSNSNAIAIRSDGALFTWGEGASGGLGNGVVINRSSPVQVTSLLSETSVNSYATYIGSSTPYLSWTQLAAGSSTFAGITSDGRLWTWGLNASGQLGNNTIVDVSYPIPIGTSSWTQVSISRDGTPSGTLHTMYAIRRDGALFSWGNNNFGQTGLSDRVHRSSPVQVGTSSWTSINAGLSYAGAIRTDGGLFVWGNPTINGVLGTNDAISRSSPVQLGTSSWISINCGYAHTAAILSTGALFTWGLNTNGQLGSNTILARSSPVQVGTSSWVAVSTGGSTTAAIRSDRGLFTWGSAIAGALASNAVIHRSSPVQVGTSSWTAISSSGNNTLARRTDGAIFGWGINGIGQIGDGTVTNKSSPVQIGTSSWTIVSVNGDSNNVASGAIRSDGRLYTWGAGNTGQLGIFRLNDQSSPVAVPAISDSWTTASTGFNTGIAIRNDGLLFTWGSNTSGQLGDNTVANKSAPVQVGNSSWASVSAGSSTTYAIRSDAALYAWGGNAQLGQVGDGTFINKSSPVQIGTNSWTLVDSNSGTTVSAIRNDGILFLWGNGANGQLGGYRLNVYGSPVQLLSMNDSWTTVGAGNSHVIAVRSDGALFAWGAGAFGRLGDNTTVDKSIPTKIGSSSWIAVSANEFSSLAIRIDNMLFGWGYGGFVDNTNINRSSPVQIGTDSWTQISGGDRYFGLIKNNNYLYMTGLNDSGQLGNLRTQSTSSPTLVKSINDSWAFITAGGGTGVNSGFMMAGRSDKLLYAWGGNPAGQLGLTDTINRSAPVQVGNSSWVSVNAGSSHTVAIRQDYSLFTWGNATSGALGDTTVVSKSSPVQIGSSLSPGYYSNSFNGSSSLLSIPNRATLNFGSNDFTIEAFVYLTATLGERVIVSLYGYSANRRSWYLSVIGQKIQFRTDDNGTTASVVNGLTTLVANTWYHIAAVKSGTTGKIYLNGVLDGTGTVDATLYNNTMDPVYIGAVGPSLTGYFAGNISNLRILNGTALYTTDFAPPTEPLTAITNTVLLTCQSSSLIDNSVYTSIVSGISVFPSSLTPFMTAGTNKAWISAAAGEQFTGAVDSNYNLYMWGLGDSGQLGTVRLTSTSSPVIVKGINDTWSTASSGGTHVVAIRSDKQLYSWGLNVAGQLGDSTVVNKSVPTLVGLGSIPDGFYSVQFNGTSNYLEIANNSAFNLGTGDFTVECWFNLTGNSSLDGANTRPAMLFGPGQLTTNEAWLLYLSGNSTTTGTGIGFQSRDTSGTPTVLSYSISITKNQWYHVAVSKVANTIALFVNGTKVAENTSWTVSTNSGGSPFRIGRRGVSIAYEQYFTGYISNIRVIKGTGIYTNSFTPDGPLTAITNTVLLTCQSITVRDNSINNFTISNF